MVGQVIARERISFRRHFSLQSGSHLAPLSKDLAFYLLILLLNSLGITFPQILGKLSTLLFSPRTATNLKITFSSSNSESGCLFRVFVLFFLVFCHSQRETLFSKSYFLLRSSRENQSYTTAIK